MPERILNPKKALRTLRKTPHILEQILKSLPAEKVNLVNEAGWGPITVLFHIYEYEQIVLKRVELMRSNTNPLLPATNNSGIAERARSVTDIASLLAEFQGLRQELLRQLEALTPEEWEYTGIHPEQGPGTILEIALNTGLHDVDHIEHILDFRF